MNTPTDKLIKQLAKRVELLESLSDNSSAFQAGLYAGQVFIIALLKRVGFSTTQAGGVDLDSVVMLGPANVPRVLPDGVESCPQHDLAVSQLAGDALNQYLFRKSALVESRRIAAARAEKEAVRDALKGRSIISGQQVGLTDVAFKAGGGGAPPAYKSSKNGEGPSL